MTTEPVPETRRSGSWAWGLAGLLMTLVTLAATYGVARSSLAFEIQFLVITICMIVLAALAYLATRAGRAATFVAVAFVLPYLLIGAFTVGAAQRVESTFEDVFSDTTSDEEPLLEETEAPSSGEVQEDYFSDLDENGDGTLDDAYSGIQCEVGSEYEQDCVDNGGTVSGE